MKMGLVTVSVPSYQTSDGETVSLVHYYEIINFSLVIEAQLHWDNGAACFSSFNTWVCI